MHYWSQVTNNVLLVLHRVSSSIICMKKKNQRCLYAAHLCSKKLTWATSDEVGKWNNFWGESCIDLSFFFFFTYNIFFCLGKIPTAPNSETLICNMTSSFRACHWHVCLFIVSSSMRKSESWVIGKIWLSILRECRDEQNIYLKYKNPESKRVASELL